jgi:endoglucanase
MKTLNACSLAVVVAMFAACSSSSAPDDASPEGAPPTTAATTVDGGPTTAPVEVLRPAPTPGSPVALHGALHVDPGGVLLDSGGSPVVLRGMSLFWSQWGAPFWNPTAIGRLARDWKATVVRAPLGIESGGYLENPAREKAKLRAVVDAAIAEGLYVIIDWHDHNAQLHTDQSKAFFDEMAGAYGSSPNVIYEIYNEPFGVPWSTIKTYAEAVIPVIRGRGARNLVVVGTPNWSQDVDVAADAPLADGNVAYALHFYAATHKGPLRDKAKAALGKRLPLFVTEWGTTEATADGVVDLVESQTWLDFLAQHRISWCNWSLGDKAEAASAVLPGTNPLGPWPRSTLTTSGAYVVEKLAQP